MKSLHDNPLYVTFLVIASWLGNALLTGIALVLALTHGQPLSPLTFFTIAVCILLGNALPLSVYYINHLWRQAGLQAEDSIAGETVRAALLRAEQLSERLGTLQDDAAKAVLVARQVPDRIENQLKKLGQSLEHPVADRSDDSLDALRGAVQEQQQQIEDLRQALLSSTVALQEIAAALSSGDGFELPLPTDEPAPQQQPEQPEAETVEKKVVEFVKEPDVEPSPKPEEVLEAEDEVKLEELPKQISEPTSSFEQDSPLEPELEEEGLFAGVPKQNTVAADEAVLIFKGWIGSYNKLFLRGDPPHLDWEKSTQPEPLGIGEWRWRVRGVKEPFKCKPILNDEHWALGPDILVQPGKLQKVDLKF